MSKNKIIPYNPKLNKLARELRKNSTLAEVLLWQRIKGSAIGYEFHRQVPLDEFIVDFYCHELMLAIELDGSSHADKEESDIRRQHRLESLGVRFIRFYDNDVKQNMSGVLVALTEKIKAIEETMN